MTDITKCPNCKSENLYCVDSRKSQGKVRRRKKCLECGFKFSTIELPMNEVYRIEKTLHLISELQNVGSLFDEIKASYKSDENYRRRKQKRNLVANLKRERHIFLSIELTKQNNIRRKNEMITREQKNGYYETEKDGENIDGLIEDVKQKMCDHYCKYPSEYKNQEQMWDEICAECPLGEL